MLLVDIRTFGYFQFFREIRTKYSSEFNKFEKFVNLMCFSTLYKKLVHSNPVHKELSKNVTGPNYATHCILKGNVE